MLCSKREATAAAAATPFCNFLVGGGGLVVVVVVASSFECELSVSLPVAGMHNINNMLQLFLFMLPPSLLTPKKYWLNLCVLST